MSPRLPAVAPREAIRAGTLRLKLDRVKGSHHVFRHPDLPRRSWYLHARDLAKGTLNQITGASGLDRDES